MPESKNRQEYFIYRATIRTTESPATKRGTSGTVTQPILSPYETTYIHQRHELDLHPACKPCVLACLTMERVMGEREERDCD